MSTNICNFQWTSVVPCVDVDEDSHVPGTVYQHECWNEEDCSGIHYCACDDVPDWLEAWILAHRDYDAGETFHQALAVAEGYITFEVNGAIVCRCCGVNYNTEVDQD